MQNLLFRPEAAPHFRWLMVLCFLALNSCQSASAWPVSRSAEISTIDPPFVKLLPNDPGVILEVNDSLPLVPFRARIFDLTTRQTLIWDVASDLRVPFQESPAPTVSWLAKAGELAFATANPSSNASPLGLVQTIASNGDSQIFTLNDSSANGASIPAQSIALSNDGKSVVYTYESENFKKTQLLIGRVNATGRRRHTERSYPRLES
jgi:hypothetical protein